MCFFIHPGYKEVRIAVEDIVCWKTLNSRRQSIYYGHYYTLDSVDVLDEEEFWPLIYPDSPNTIKTGYHSYSSSHRAKRSLDIIRRENIYECIIPKRSKYFYNPVEEEFVSSRIIIKK